MSTTRSAAQPFKRCAVYTRKSSEEGLDQEFNSLDAQREAGEAYVKSQSHEGWRLVPTHYDDGGYSGGSMERPGLAALLADIATGRIDVVVVYKIDRLTRSLADFARMVELFDRHEVSFVSVTQSFNTTSSMGRLTLNVLLSFAQFEREVTGERIRDKIAASKARGMWMGGTLPLGYDLPEDQSRALRVNEGEAEQVRSMFKTYLQLGSVHALERHLAEAGIVSKKRTTRSGKQLGGQSFSRGALFHLLRNRTYIGRIPHRDTDYPGAHAAIVDHALFDAVQKQLDTNKVRGAAGTTDHTPAPLTGRLFDGDGNPMSPSWSRGKSGRLYRYYVSAPLQQGARIDRSHPRRCSATRVERALTDILAIALPSLDQPLASVTRVELFASAMRILLPTRVRPQLCLPEGASIDPAAVDRSSIALTVPISIVGGGGYSIAGSSAHRPVRDPALIKALRRAHGLLAHDRGGMPIADAAPSSPYLRRLMRLAFLAPDIQRDILDGRQPRSLNLEALMAMELPLDWCAQRRMVEGMDLRQPSSMAEIPAGDRHSALPFKLGKIPVPGD